MTYTEQIIEKAREGGHKHPKKVKYLDAELALTFLTPSFWQSLGKALGWNGKHKWYPKNTKDWYYKQYGAKAKRCMICQTDNFNKDYINPYTNSFVSGASKECPTNTPIYHWHDFIDHIAKRKTAEDFFKELLK